MTNVKASSDRFSLSGFHETKYSVPLNYDNVPVLITGHGQKWLCFLLGICNITGMNYIKTSRHCSIVINLWANKYIFKRT